MSPKYLNACALTSHFDHHLVELYEANALLVFSYQCRDVARKKYRAVDAYSGVCSSKPSAKQGSLPMKNLKTIIMLLHC